MKLVVIESPFAGDTVKHLAYLDRCIRDCLARGETPYASHKMLTTALDDLVPEQRKLGIEAGLAWRRRADGRVFYLDLGWSRGMTEAFDLYRHEGLTYAVADLGKPIENRDKRPPEKLIGKRIGIHAGMKPVDLSACQKIEGDPFITQLIDETKVKVRGAIVCTTLLAGWIAKQNGEHVGTIRGAEADRLMLSAWWIGPVGYVLRETRPLVTPVPCRGFLYFWPIPADVRAEIGRQEAA